MAKNIIVVILLVSFAVCPVNAGECVASRDLENLVVLRFSACLTEYSLQSYRGDKVNYDLKACEKSILSEMSQYFDVCAQAKTITVNTVISYSLCKTVRMIERAKGFKVKEIGNDQVVCEQKVRDGTVFSFSKRIMTRVAESESESN